MPRANPRAGWTAHDERQYRDALASIRRRRLYRGREEEVAARIVNAARARKRRRNVPASHTMKGAKRRRKRSRSSARTVRGHLKAAGVALLDRRLGTSILHAGRAVAHAVRRTNPPLPVRTFTGKSGHLVSEHVLAIDYRHASSAQRTPYRHDFGAGVELWALRDGSLLLRGGHGQRLWEDFFVSESE